MGNNTANRIAAKAKSQTGASLSVALLLMLVCVAISAAVLAASTASAGRFANQGEMDQRYYAVTSAAQLFRDSLGPDDEISFVFTQEREGARVSGGSGDGITWENTVVLASPIGRVVSSADTSRHGYNFLPGITSYALYAVKRADVGVAETDSGSNLTVSGSGWVEPFTLGEFGSVSAPEYKDFTYTIAPSTDDLSGKLITVGVKARLHRDWTLELDFYNTQDKNGANLGNSAEDKAKKFHLYMAFGASTSDEVVPAGSTGQQVQEDRRTTVSWRLQRIVPGREI